MCRGVFQDIVQIFSVDGLRKFMEKLSEDSRPPGRDLKVAPVEK
jgi:hypothetical protein